MNGPSFLGIGAQKAGTTWLWENLRGHPQLWLPLVKELHWFDVRYPPQALADGQPYRHAQGLARYRPLWRQPSLAEARWLRRFYHGLGGSDADYLALFPRDVDCRRGEITPAYATLDAGTVQQLHALLPADCRILFVMREPVERLWSGLRMYCRKRGLDCSTMTADELDALAQLPAHALRSDYARTLAHWSVFGDRLGLFFYEDLRADPAAFLHGVLRFLGVDAGWHSPRLHTPSNTGGAPQPLPAALRVRWQQRYRPVVAAVQAVAGRVPAAWEAAA